MTVETNDFSWVDSFIAFRCSTVDDTPHHPLNFQYEMELESFLGTKNRYNIMKKVMKIVESVENRDGQW